MQQKDVDAIGISELDYYEVNILSCHAYLDYRNIKKIGIRL